MSRSRESFEGHRSPRDTVRRLIPVSRRRRRIGRFLGPAAIALAVGVAIGGVLAVLPAPDRPEDTPEARAAGHRFHRVQEGENLRELAGRYYRDPSRWKEIFHANRQRLVGERRLVPGEVLLIPIFEPEPDHAAGGY